jgi:hypothetical protein
MAEGSGGDLKLPRVKPEFEGFLTKRSTWLKDWRSRYFRLIGNKLYFSKDTTVRRRRRRRLRGGCAAAAKRSAPLRERSAATPVACALAPPPALLAQDEPHGVIDLKDCLTVKSAEEKSGKPHSFEVATPEHTYYMYADDEAAKDEWIGAIGKAIVRFSRSYRPEEVDDDSSSDDDLE